MDPKFEFGGGAQKWSKNVLNLIVWDQFLIKPRKLIANLDPKFEFGGVAQKWWKNVLNSIVWAQFLVKPKKLQIWAQNSNLEVLSRNGRKMY